MPYIGDYISLQTGGQWCRGGVGDYISQQTDGHWIINDYSDINYTGSINAIIDTYSKIYFKQPILISGHIAAEIDLISKVNAGKIKAINPMLIAQNSSYNFGDCPIAVIEYEGFSPDNIINIISTEDNIYENSVDFHIIETANKEGSYFPINYYHYSEKASGLIDYLVTNYRSQNDAGTPLFYQYELLFDAVSDIVKI